MSSDICFIVNCSSNRDRAWAKFEASRGLVDTAFPDAAVIPIGPDHSLRDAAYEAAQSYRYVVAVGGDGTVHEVAAALVNSDSILGVLPMGSGNDFAKSLGLSLEFEQDLNTLREGVVDHVDVIMTEDNIILNTFGMGVDGLTNYFSAHSGIRNATLRYFLAALRALMRAERFRYLCDVDGERTEGVAWMIAAANGSIEGGRYKISPESNITDGEFEVVIIRDQPKIRLLYEFLRLSVGLPFSDHIARKTVCHSTLYVRFDRPVMAHADGEISDTAEHYRFTLRKQALPVIIGSATH